MRPPPERCISNKAKLYNFLKVVKLTADTDADVDTGEFLLANDQKWLLEFELECLWLNLLEGLAIDLDEALAGLAGGDGVGSLLASVDLNGLWWLSSWHFGKTDNSEK